MKKVYLLMSAAILVLVVSASAFLRANAPNHGNAFSYTVTDNTVSIKVVYNPEQASRVEIYVDSCLQPQIVFGHDHAVNKEVLAGNGRLGFHVKAKPGALKITADRSGDNTDARNKLRGMLEGLRSLIKPE